MKILGPYLRAHLGELGWGFFFLLIQNYSYLRIPEYMRLILDEIGGQNRHRVIVPLMLSCIVYILLMAGSLFLMRKLIIGVSRKIEFRFRELIYHKLTAMKYEFYRNFETGDLTSRCTNDLNDVRTLLGPGLMYIPNSLSRLLFFLPVLIQLNGPMMLVLGVMMAILIVMIILILPRLRPYFKAIQQAMGQMNNRVWQIITGISTIKQFNMEASETQRFVDMNKDYVRLHMKLEKFRGFLWPLFMFLFSITQLVILLQGGLAVIHGRMTLGELLQFSMMIAFLTFPILSLGWVMSMIQQGIGAMERINRILDDPGEEKSHGSAMPTENLCIEVTGLRHYLPDAGKEILKDVSLAACAGETIGLTGRVGCGKSTLLNLLGGLYLPEPGSVHFSGVDITEVRPDQLNRSISMVAQNPFLFSRSLIENIALGDPDPDLARIDQAAAMADIKREILEFPDQYNQVVGERGLTLSGGQRQRIAIARALYKSAPILILDDPLSSVDAETEAKIIKNLILNRVSPIILISSHRISALKNCDRIYVLNEGKIYESGTHSQLLERKGLYYRIACMQQLVEEAC